MNSPKIFTHVECWIMLILFIMNRWNLRQIVNSHHLITKQPVNYSCNSFLIVHREYETDATMTSRFGKTYSRRGGDGTSKFDEVLSNKRATLSTKWGETTYKAKVGAKRPGLKTEVTDQTKRTKVSDGDGSEDPFGFDSDDESRPVTSRNVAQPKPKVTSTGGSQASLTLEPNSRVNQPACVEAVAPSRAPFTLSTERSAHKVPEDPGNFFNASTTGMFFPEGFFFLSKNTLELCFNI